MSISKGMSFHEATVTRFCKYDAILELELENVLVDGNKSRVMLRVSPVISIEIDNELSEKPLMELDDGEILSLDVSEGCISAIIEWNDFSRGVSFTKAYRISGGSISVLVV